MRIAFYTNLFRHLLGTAEEHDGVLHVDCDHPGKAQAIEAMLHRVAAARGHGFTPMDVLEVLHDSASAVEDGKEPEPGLEEKLEMMERRKEEDGGLSPYEEFSK